MAPAERRPCGMHFASGDVKRKQCADLEAAIYHKSQQAQAELDRVTMEMSEKLSEQTAAAQKREAVEKMGVERIAFMEAAVARWPITMLQ